MTHGFAQLWDSVWGLTQGACIFRGKLGTFNSEGSWHDADHDFVVHVDKMSHIRHHVSWLWLTLTPNVSEIPFQQTKSRSSCAVPHQWTWTTSATLYTHNSFDPSTGSVQVCMEPAVKLVLIIMDTSSSSFVLLVSLFILNSWSVQSLPSLALSTSLFFSLPLCKSWVNSVIPKNYILVGEACQ